MRRRTVWIALAAAAAPLLGAEPPAATVAAARDVLLARVPAARIAFAPATGVARWARLPLGAAGDLAPDRAGTPEQRARSFLAHHRALFGLVDPAAELAILGDRVDELGFRHLTFRQIHRGVPVFGGLARAHFDREGRLRSVHGTLVPDLDLDVRPRVEAVRAIEEARGFAASELSAGAALPLVHGARLVVYRRGLERPGPGAVHLAWEVDVAGGGGPARVFVDASSGKVVDWLPEARDARFRRAYSGLDQAPLDGVPDSFPGAPDWVEGDAWPTGIAELDGALAATADVHARFAALGRDSWDGAGHTLDLSWNRASFCPNASWNGFLASFCAGFSVHDVVAHEWTHAFTGATSGLIYRWQSGALDESFSDVFGEALDLSTRLVGVDDTDEPAQRRADATCSGFVPARLEVKRPPAVAGDWPVGLASFGSPPGDGPPVDLVRVVDGGGANPHDGCEPIPASAGAWIAFADRGACDFEIQARHAQAAGAIGLVIGNLSTSPSPDVAPAMSCDFVTACDLSVRIPTVSLAVADADALRAALPEGVRASIRRGANTGSADSVRWLLGEDVRPLGLARDMWAPTCLGAPGRVPDPEYACTTADSGGVHTNSGVPNRAFALVVDGGTANGVEVGGIGLAAALHVWWRAMTVYETPTSDFADHAEALEASCDDLVGASLADPWGGPPVTLSAGDCAQVAAASLAVELRADPPCHFERLLAPGAPPLCGDGDAYELSLSGFDEGDDGWTASRRDVASPATFDPRDWTRVGQLPDARPGVAFFAPDPPVGRCVTGQSGDDDSGVLVLESPELLIPIGRPARLAFDHYVATERDWDGGNLKLSVDGGPWTLVPGEAFVWNAYVGPLFAPPSNSDPLAGEPAFHGTDEGSNSSSWGTSIVDLSGLVAPGEPFRLRFELGTDLCVGTGLGWWVDDVHLVACADPGPVFLDGFETGGTGRWSAVAAPAAIGESERIDSR